MMDFRDWYGKPVVDRDGKKVGSIGQLYVDDRNDSPAWATVKTGLFGTKENFFPVSMAHVHGEEIMIDMPADEVKNAPKVEADEMLSPDEQQELYTYYKEKWSEHDRDEKAEASAQDNRAMDSTGHDTSGPTTDDAMTRSEERLDVGKRREEVGRVKLKKYIVTDHVTATVPVEREEVQLVREPITDENLDQATDGPTLSEEEHEVVLHEERPTATKKTVPVERVRLGKETTQHDKKISRDIKKEQIDIQGDGDKKPHNL